MRPALTLILLATVALVQAQGNVPAGWRTPTESELADDLGWRKEDDSSFLAIRADFDGDGQEDDAQLLVNSELDATALLVHLARERGSRRLGEFPSKSWVQAFGVSLLDPGVYKTACGKGYFECDADNPEVLRLQLPGIELFKFASASSVFVWNQQSDEFIQIWLSD